MVLPRLLLVVGLFACARSVSDFERGVHTTTKQGGKPVYIHGPSKDWDGPKESEWYVEFVDEEGGAFPERRFKHVSGDDLVPLELVEEIDWSKKLSEFEERNIGKVKRDYAWTADDGTTGELKRGLYSEPDTLVLYDRTRRSDEWCYKVWPTDGSATFFVITEEKWNEHFELPRRHECGTAAWTGKEIVDKVFNNETKEITITKADENHDDQFKITGYTLPINGITLTRHKVFEIELDQRSRWACEERFRAATEDHGLTEYPVGGVYFGSPRWKLYITSHWVQKERPELHYGLVLDYVPRDGPRVKGVLQRSRFRLAPENLKWEDDKANIHWQLENDYNEVADVTTPYKELLKVGDRVTVIKKSMPLDDSSGMPTLESVRVLTDNGPIDITAEDWKSHFEPAARTMETFIGLQLQRSSVSPLPKAKDIGRRAELNTNRFEQDRKISKGTVVTITHVGNTLRRVAVKTDDGKKLTVRPEELLLLQTIPVSRPKPRKSADSSVASENPQLNQNSKSEPAYKSEFKAGQQIISTTWTFRRYGTYWVGTLEKPSTKKGDWNKNRHRWVVNWEFRHDGKKIVKDIPDNRKRDVISEKNFMLYKERPQKADERYFKKRAGMKASI